MARPTRQPTTGVYQFRKRVPTDVRRLVGGPAEVKVTLGTRDPGKAAEAFRRKDTEFEARWAEVRKGVQDLDHETVEALGGEVYRDLVARPGKDRGLWIHHSYAWFLFKCEKLDQHMREALLADWWPDMETLHGANLDKVLDDRGMAVTPHTRENLLLAAHRAGRQAAGVIVRQATGDYSPDHGADRFPPLAKATPAKADADFETVWAGWVAEVRPSHNTQKRWRPVLERMLAFTGEKNLGLISEAVLKKWLKSLVGELGNNTIDKVHLAAVKRIFKHARKEGAIILDPARDLSIASGIKYGTKMRGYSDDEAAQILGECLKPHSDRMTNEHQAARRWVPWICAYTGARVNEVTQLRACDVKTLYGQHYININPDAGTTKTGARKVPLHPDLMRQGFGTFLNTRSGTEPLFYKPVKNRPEEFSGMPPYEEMGTRLSKWVRRLGLNDMDIDPNHAWRHRFKSIAYRFGIEQVVADAIQGHAPTTAGGRYGEVELPVMFRAIQKIPRFDPSDLKAYKLVPETDVE